MGKKVLIVDNSHENKKLLIDFISQSHNAIVDVVGDEENAFDKVNLNAYNIVLIEATLMGLNGVRRIARIKQFEKFRQVKIIVVADIDGNLEGIRDLLDTGVIDYYTRSIHSEDLKRWMSFYFHFLDMQSDVTEKLSLLNADLKNQITQTLDLQVQLQKAKKNFINIVGKTDAAILIVDNNGIIKYVNESGETIFGRSAKELVGEDFGSVAFENRTEINIIRKNKEIGVGELTTTKTQWENEPAWVVLINDITEHKQLEDRLTVAKEKAQESDRLKSAFLSNMSHEIRTPMNSILGFVNFINDDVPFEKREEYIEIIKSSGNYLLDLINDIIDLSKIEAGQLNITPRLCELDQLLNEVKNFFASNKKIENKAIKLVLNIPDQDGGLTITTDPFRLRQIIINLIGNALKFTEDGFVEYGYVKKGNSLNFFVKDTGKGISKQNVKKIFNRFTQVDHKDTNLTKGTGLGLTISESLIKLLGGNIWVESKEGVGSVFYFTIPLKETKGNTSTNRLVISDVDLKLKNKTIMIIEDEDYNHSVMEMYFGDTHSKLIWSKDTSEAVDLLRTNDVDLILIDIKMSQISGYEAIKEIRNHNKDIPIIAQTVYDLKDEEEKCANSGCNGYIIKPFSNYELKKAISKHLKVHSLVE